MPSGHGQKELYLFTEHILGHYVIKCFGGHLPLQGQQTYKCFISLLGAVLPSGRKDNVSRSAPCMPVLSAVLHCTCIPAAFIACELK